ncbi:hypothetical protein Bhyg_10549, partial [Pseudolycoriella hygida]
MNNQFSLNNGHPIAKNDLIEGREFLSVFLNQRHTDSDRRQIANNEKSQKATRNPSSEAPRVENVKKKILFNEEDILPQSSNYYGYNGLTSTLDLRTTTNGLEVTTERINDESKYTDLEDTGKNIVKFITSGSKIVFLEDIPTEKESEANGKLVDDHTVKTSPSNTDEIKVISVSISSSETRSEGKSPKNASNVTHSYDDNENILITGARQRDFPIEESDAKTQDDSAKEGSTRIQRIVSPPKHVSSDTNESFDPFETALIQDDHYHKEGSARPRSVSHSSLSQITDPDFWHTENKSADSRSNRTTKQHFREPAPQYSDTENIYDDRTKSFSEVSKLYSVPSKFYSQPSKVYSEPAKVYGRPEKVYSVPSKIYSEPSRVYSEPSRIYSEPSKFYGQPSKFYANPDPSTTSKPKKVIFNLDKLPYDLLNAPTRDLLTNNHRTESRFSHLSVKIRKELTTQKSLFESTTVDYSPTPEQNYEIDETVSVMTNGRQHGVQITNSPDATPAPLESSHDDPDPKVGYVVEGRNFRKYRVEEKTADGFIVGEYGVVSNDDGSLRGQLALDINLCPDLTHNQSQQHTVAEDGCALVRFLFLNKLIYLISCTRKNCRKKFKFNYQILVRLQFNVFMSNSQQPLYYNKSEYSTDIKKKLCKSSKRSQPTTTCFLAFTSEILVNVCIVKSDSVSLKFLFAKRMKIYTTNHQSLFIYEMHMKKNSIKFLLYKNKEKKLINKSFDEYFLLEVV